MKVFNNGVAAVLTVIMFLVQPHSTYAQREFQFDPGLTYDSSVPSPESYLGYDLGAQFTTHAEVVNYFKTLAGASERITVKKYGETHEGRGLYIAVITSERNQSMIDRLRRNNLRLSDPDSLDDAAADLLVSNQPVTVWLSYNVHGNEPSSSEAAMQTAYRLVAGTDTETQRFREEAITIIDPMINPDGRDRYVYWYKSAKSDILNTNAEDYEHDEPWPGGRTNHYWFDLNRDWVWLVHPESRGRVHVYQQWLPQVHLDLHEQGFNSNYFTMPGTTPRNHELPDAYEKWADTFGRGVIEEFDKYNINYATREAFDFFYPGYGSSYPSNLGAIGMLAEQGGHSRGGRAVETEDGYMLTLRQRIFDHYTNSIATVRTAVENREPLLDYFRDAFSPENRKGNIQAFILPDNTYDYTYKVLDILHRHGIRIERATEDFTVREAYSYRDGRPDRRTFDAGSYIIPTDQPRHILIHTLMKRQLAIRDSVMYDMSTWSIPLAYNLDAAWTTRNPEVPTEKVDNLPSYGWGVDQNPAGYAYVIDWKQLHAPRALAMLWKKGYRVRSTGEPFTYRDKTYSRGSLVVLIGRNHMKKDVIHSNMESIAREARVRINSFDTGRMESGIDLASRDSEPVARPEVVLMVDAPFSSYTSGQLWYLFDQWTKFGINRIRSEDLQNLDLYDYDVLVFPGTWGSLSSVLDSTALERLKMWARDGGTIVATENSAEFFTKNQSTFTPLELVEEPKPGSDEENEKIAPAAYTRYAAREDSVGLRRIPGSAMQGWIDNTNPLAFGMPETVYSLKFSDEAIKPVTGWQTVGYYDKDYEDILVSGYASQENREKLAGNAFAGVYPMGSGKVVFLLDNTQYRMFWLGPARMMQNAVMILHDM